MFSWDEKEILRKILSQEPGLTAETVERLYTDILDRDFSLPQPEGPVCRRRWDHEVIEMMVPHQATVLDLGCGDGELLWRLHEKKGVRGQGVETETELVLASLTRGVPVLQTDIDKGLGFLGDALFDYVVLEETLQAVRRPYRVLREMLRVGKVGIVSFPNFGHWRIRMQLLVEGVMPRTSKLPYTWYDTPNIHLLTIRDFEKLCGEEGLFVAARYAYSDGSARPLIPEDNLLAEEALYVLSSTGPKA